MAKRKKIEDKAEQPKGMVEKLGVESPVDLASTIVRDFNQSEQTKWLWIPERNRDVKDYFGVIQNSEWPFKGASQIKSQFQRIVVDTFAGNMLKSLFLPEHPIRVYPSPLGNKTTEIALENMKYVEDLHNALQADDYNLKEVLDKAIQTALIESFVVLHPTYEYLTNEIITSVKRWIPKDLNVDDLTYDLDTDTVTTKDGKFVPSVSIDRDYMTPAEAKQAGMEEVQFDITKEECIKDGISIKVINGYRFYLPLGSPGESPYEKVQRAPYVIHQLFYTLKEVQRYSDQGYFENVNIIYNYMYQSQKDNTRAPAGTKGALPVIPATVYDRQRELITYTKLQQAGFLLDTARLEYEYVEVLKWCGRWKINGKEQNVIVWMDRNTHTILRVEPNIHGIKPYFPIVPFPVDETPYGESLCKIIRPLVQEINLLLRTITNIALQKSAPPKFYDPASGFNPATVGQFGPNSWIPAREPSRNVLIPPQPEDPQVAMQMVQLLINIVERITGINEVVQGQISDTANTTATEVQTAMARAGVRFDQVYDRMKGQIKPMFKYIHKLILRYMPPVKEIRLMGAENANRLVQIYKDQLNGVYEFELAGNSIVTEQAELQNSQILLNTMMQNQAATAYLSYKPESIYYILFNFIKRLNPIAMNKILPKPDEVAQLERDRQKTQSEQEQLALQHVQQQQQVQAQAAQQQQQLQAQIVQQELQGKAAEKNLDLNAKQAQVSQQLKQQEDLHNQKLRHQEELHKQKLAMGEQNAKAKEKSKENNSK